MGYVGTVLFAFHTKDLYHHASVVHLDSLQKFTLTSNITEAQWSHSVTVTLVSPWSASFSRLYRAVRKNRCWSHSLTDYLKELHRDIIVVCVTSYFFLSLPVSLVFMNTSVISSSPMERKKPPRRVSRLPTSDFRLPTSNFRLPTSVAIKGGGRPTRLLPYSKMLLVSIMFFPSAG